MPPSIVGEVEHEGQEQPVREPVQSKTTKSTNQDARDNWLYPAVLGLLLGTGHVALTEDALCVHPPAFAACDQWG